MVKIQGKNSLWETNLGLAQDSFEAAGKGTWEVTWAGSMERGKFFPQEELSAATLEQPLFPDLSLKTFPFHVCP